MTALGIVIVAVAVGLGLVVAVPMILSSLRAQRASAGVRGDGGAAGTPLWGGDGGADCGADGGGGCD